MMSNRRGCHWALGALMVGVVPSWLAACGTSQLSERADCETYSTCGAGAETVLCTVQNGTHCGSYTSFMIPELAWSVLERHALP